MQIDACSKTFTTALFVSSMEVWNYVRFRSVMVNDLCVLDEISMQARHKARKQSPLLKLSK